MAEENPDPIDAQDRQFKRRLNSRDPTVLRDIEAAFKRPIVCLLRQRLQPVDAEVVFNEALLNLWECYREDGGATVRGFLFKTSRRRMADLIRRMSRQRDEIAIVLGDSALDDVTDDSRPDAGMMSAEEQEQVARKRQLVEDACSELTPLQQRAFRSRFLGSSDSAWAKRLESETRVPAKSWRKHSDAAVKKVRKLVSDKQRQDREGERHDVA